MFRKVVCAVAILAISLGVAMADTLKGKIAKIDGNKVSVEYKDKATKEVKCVVVDITDAKVCGQAKSATELKVGQHVTVEHKDAKATEVKVNPPHKKKEAK